MNSCSYRSNEPTVGDKFLIAAGAVGSVAVLVVFSFLICNALKDAYECPHGSYPEDGSSLVEEDTVCVYDDGTRTRPTVVTPPSYGG